MGSLKEDLKFVKNNKTKLNSKNKSEDYKVRGRKLCEDGITIIALVITIIILLILAGITISMVSNDGILGKAKNAAAISEKASAEEEMSMYLASLEVSKAEDENKRLADYIQDDLGNGEVEDFLNNGDGYAQVTITW